MGDSKNGERIPGNILIANIRNVYTIIIIPSGPYVDRHPERYVLGTHERRATAAVGVALVSPNLHSPTEFLKIGRLD